jgi:hypothetical protein
MTRHATDGCARCKAAADDHARIRRELTLRLDKCDPFDYEAALRWLADNNPDAVNEALTEIGGPPL